MENLENLALEAGCKVGRLPSSYLGIPLGANHKSVAVWDGVEERFRKRLALWKRIYFQRRENYSNSEYIVKYAYILDVFTSNAKSG